MRSALAFAVAFLTLSGCTAVPGSPWASTPEAALPRLPGPEIPRLDNASWPGMARAIAHMEETIENASAPTNIASGGQLYAYQSAAAFDLARGALFRASWSATIAIDILHGGEMVSKNETVAIVQAQSDAMETDVLSRFPSHETDLCGVNAAFLAAWSTISNRHVGDMQAANDDPDNVNLSASFRWSLLFVAGQLLNETGCDPTTLRPVVQAWAEDLIQRDAPFLPSDLPGIEAREAVDMLNWAKVHHLEHAQEFLAVRAAALSERARLYQAGTHGPDLAEVARLANTSFAEHPTGLAALTYSAGAMAYDEANDSWVMGDVDPQGSTKSAVFFAAATSDPKTAYDSVR